MRSKKENETMMELYRRAKIFEPKRVDDLYEMYIMGMISADEFKFELERIVRDWYE